VGEGECQNGERVEFLIRLRRSHMLLSRMLVWAAVLLALLPPMSLLAQRAPGATHTEITFTLKDSSRSGQWPVAIRGVTVRGKAIQFDRPVRMEGNWLSTVVITLVNVSPKTMVRAGMDITFPDSGDGSAQHPYLGSQSVSGRVPKIVYLTADGYNLPPWWDHDAPLQLSPGGVLRLFFAGGSNSTQEWLGQQSAIRAVFMFDTFYFADNSRWSASQYALAPNPPSRAWRMVSKDEFLRSAKVRP